MRKCIAVAAVLAMCGPVLANSLGYPNEVINGGFETGDYSGWDASGGLSVYNSGDWGVQAPEGAKYGGYITSGGVQSESLLQWVDNTQSPGWDPSLNQKMIDLEFYALLHARHYGSTWENVFLDVIIDWYDDAGGYHEAPVYSATNLTLAENAIEWVPVHVDFLIPDAQPSEISLHFLLRNQDPMEWNYAFIDGIDLESQCVPEPGVLMLLTLGGLVLLRLRRR